ncbi:MAG: GNAT family N-acetyltransferase [Sphingobacterium sp.]|jgi:ElaA protein|uniref:GNAT family N-acetyltransferase n=1 Tax=Sphingobacterium sp. TaxID=341027 RepID=UPI002816E967|nr:GNAT family N-acetyltransferase [Sphingobacterium sp.]MDR0265569.1 GNAT family N-acetyltransferase [Sphingobacterium sp.]
MALQWNLKKFDELSNKELYRILKLRMEVFVLEQECLYPELDDKDFACLHLWAEQEGSILAYTRLVPPGLSYPQASIGRVIVAEQARGTGLSQQLMISSIESVSKEFGVNDIQIGAQFHLKSFYEKLGFRQVSEPYPDYGILHIDMIKSPI